MDITAIAGSISAAIGITKELVSADRAFDKAELRLKLADLMVELANARTEALDIQMDNARLHIELTKLQQRLSFQGSLRFKMPYYISEGQEDGGPYCANCWDGEHLAMHLIVRDPGEWYCSRCKHFVRDSNYTDPGPIEPHFG
jgi:hypothetical protein